MSNLREMKTPGLSPQITNIKESLVQCKRPVNRPGSTHSPLVHHVTRPPLPSSADNTYRFCHETRGFAVLIINSKFDDQAKRENAVWDEYYMYKMFKELNFDVYILRNLASKELLEKMKGTHVSISCPFIINTRLLNCNIMLIKWR